MLGGELGNSSASSLAFMQPVWGKLQAMHMNTVLMPVYWELIEPEENKFDFTLVDSLVSDAANNNLHLVLLWFGTDRQVHDSNYNLLWALPTNAIAAFAIWKKPSWLRKYFTVSSFIYVITLLLWAWLPQELNIALVPIVILLLFRSLTLKRSA